MAEPSHSDPSDFKSTPKVDFTKPLDTSSLKDQSVLVTGGANGIGAGFVTALAEAGAYVTIADVKAKDGEELAKDPSGKGLRVQSISTDVTSWTSQVAAFKHAISFSPHSTLDIVIACAGIPGDSAMVWYSNPPTDPSTGDPLPPRTAVLDINLTGVFYTAHLALHYFRTTPAGPAPSKQLVFIGSLASYAALPMLADYTAAKWGVRGLWRALRDGTEVLGEGKPIFRTNLIAPTYVRTPMTAAMEEKLLGANVKMAEVSDVVDGMLRLVTDEAVIGRAIAIAPKKQNFDLCDDYEGFDAGRELLEKLQSGLFGTGLMQLGEAVREGRTTRI